MDNVDDAAAVDGRVHEVGLLSLARGFKSRFVWESGKASFSFLYQCV